MGIKDENLMPEVVKRLDVLIALFLEMVGKEPQTTMTDRIARLDELGLAPGEIGKILGKPINYITGALGARKRRKG